MSCPAETASGTAGTPPPVAVVMGGGRGIGEAIVRRLSADGYVVMIADHLAKLAKSLAYELREQGREIYWQKADVTDPAQLKELVEQLRKVTDGAGIRVAVNSVGIFDQRAPLLKTKAATFERIMKVNVTGALLFSQAIEPLLANNASLVHIGSINGLLAGAGLGAYKVSKAAMHMLARCLALELAPAPRRIRVNVVAPGWVDTPGERLALQREAKGDNHPLDDPDTAKWIPLGRRNNPCEIADMVAFLCSDQAVGITGQVFSVDGGIAAHRGV